MSRQAFKIKYKDTGLYVSDNLSGPNSGKAYSTLKGVIKTITHRFATVWRNTIYVDDYDLDNVYVEIYDYSKEVTLREFLQINSKKELVTKDEVENRKRFTP